MLVRPLPPSFLDTYSLSIFSLGCNTSCMVISFLVLSSICLSSSLVHFKKSPKYLTRSTAQFLISVIRFRQDSFVSSSFLVLLRYFFQNFFFHLHLLDVNFQDAQVFLGYLFSERSNLVLIRYFHFLSQMSFDNFHYLHGIFFYIKFHSYVLKVYSNWVY